MLSKIRMLQAWSWRGAWLKKDHTYELRSEEVKMLVEVHKVAELVGVETATAETREKAIESKPKRRKRGNSSRAQSIQNR